MDSARFLRAHASRFAPVQMGIPRARGLGTRGKVGLPCDSLTSVLAVTRATHPGADLLRHLRESGRGQLLYAVTLRHFEPRLLPAAPGPKPVSALGRI